MRLQNLGTDYYRDERDFTSNGSDVRLAFFRFGRGAERTPDFLAVFDWDDVEALIQAFAKNNHPEALRHIRAMTLATAVEGLLRNPESGDSPVP